MSKMRTPEINFDQKKKADLKKTEPEKLAAENRPAEITLEYFRSIVEKNTTLEPHTFCSACSQCGGVFLHALFRAGPWLCLSCWPPESETWSDAPWMAWKISADEKTESEIGFLRSGKLKQEFSSGTYWAVADRRAIAKQRHEAAKQREVVDSF